VGRWLWLALLVDVPTDDAMHDFFFVVILFIARGFCSHGRHHWGPPSRMWGDPSHSALQILNERFARGEIQKNEYTEKKAAILSGG
jgi:uncharacterized membrane protein